MRLSLLFLLSFVAISAVPSGLLLMYQPSGSLLGLSPSILAYSPFQNFFLPGLLLAIVVGGISIVGIVLLIAASPNAYRFSLAAGVILFIWIITQIALVHYYQLLQGIYLGIGLLISLISYQLMGKTAL